VSWSNAEFDWSIPVAAIFRSTWDYFDRFAEFSTWLDRVAPVMRLFNSSELIRWNWDKHYLSDLQRKGICIPPTIFLEKGSRRSLFEVWRGSGWQHAILKPAVSGGSRHTYLLDEENVEEVSRIFSTLISEEAMLLQAFQERVVRDGEISVIVIGGKTTHAVRKRPKLGDFRVQDEHGGTVHPHTPLHEEIAAAERAVAACPEPPLYARIDLVADDTGTLAVMELELIEPELFFRFYPEAAELLADEIVRQLQHGMPRMPV
jgi:glutathione synthase/RimK-type ligase-like ATP-grasp enzyme